MPAEFGVNINVKLVGPTNVNQVLNQVRDQMRGLKQTVNLDTSGARAGVNQLTSGLQANQSALRVAQAQASAFNVTLSGTVSVANQGASSLANFGAQAGLAARRFLAFTVAAGAMVNLVQQVKDGIKAAVDFDLSMNKVAQVSSESASSIAGLRQTISGLSTSFGVSSATLAETAVTLKQAGLTANQTKDALEALALVDLAPSFDGQKQATEGLIAAFRQFDLSSKDFKSSLSSINAVAAGFAVESADIVTAIQKAGGAFKVSAGDMKGGQQALNEFVALFTTVRDTTRESADSIATGLRTVFTRLQRQDTVKALHDLGIELRYTQGEAESLGRTDLTNQFVGAYEAVKRLSQGLDGLRTTDPRYAQVVEQLGGYRQISRVIPLLQQFETAQKALNVAQSGSLSLQAAAEKRQESLAFKVSQLKEQYLDLFRKIVDSKGFQSLSESLLGVASSFGKVLDFARPLLPLLTTLATIKVATGLGSILGNFGRSFIAPVGSSTTGPRRFATGGVVPGSGNNDTEPALLMPGEFVLNKQAVARMGVPNLRDLNEGRARIRISRYAEGSTSPVGGVVSPSSAVTELGGLAGAAKEAASAMSSLVDRLRAKQGNNTKVNQADVQTAATFVGRPAAFVHPDEAGANAEKLARARIDAGAEAQQFAAEQSRLANKSFAAKIPTGLTPEGQAFFAANYDKALKLAHRTASKDNIDFANRGDDVLENAAVSSLGATAAKFGKAGFDPAKAEGYLRTVVRRNVRKATNDFFGSGGANAVNANLSLDAIAPGAEEPLHRLVASQSVSASEAAALREQEARLKPRVDQAKTIIGSLPTTQNGTAISEHRQLQLKAQELGLGAGGKTEDLRERIADYVSGKLTPTTPVVGGAGQGPPTPPTQIGGGAPQGPPKPPAPPAQQPNPTPPDDGRGRNVTSGLTNEEHAYQLRALAAAKAKYGGVYGVAEDDLARNRQLGRGQATGTIQAFDFDLRQRAANGSFVDPLIVARDTRRQRLEENRANQQLAADNARVDQLKVAERANSSGRERLQIGDVRGTNALNPVVDSLNVGGREVKVDGVQTITQVGARQTAPLTVGDRVLARQERDALGIAGETDPLKIKAAAIAAFQNGEGGILGDEGQGILGLVKDKLSPAQYAQVVGAARNAGFDVGKFGLQKSPFKNGGAADTVLTQFTGEGDNRTLAGGLLADRAKALADVRTAARGGAANLSDSTKATIQTRALQDQEQKLRRELISAQQNLLKQLQPQMAATERLKKATEDADRAMSGLAKVSRDSQGKLLGLSETVGRATAAGITATGAGGRWYGLTSTVGDVWNDAREGAGGAFSRFRQSRVGQRLEGIAGAPGFGYLAAGVGIAGAHAADYFDRRSGSAEEAAKSATGIDSYSSNKTASGGIQGALTGAAAGAAIGTAFGGPIGTAVGGIIGAVAGGAQGIYSAMKDAESDIRQAKINNAVTELSDKLNAFATGIPDAAALSGIKTNLDVYEKEARQRVIEKADDSYFFEPERNVNAQKYATFAQADLRKEFGPLLPQIGQGLARSAERLGRENYGEQGKAGVDGLVNRFLEAGENRRLLDISSRLKGTTLTSETDTVRKTIVEAQKAAQRDQENKTARIGVEQNVNTFSRLLQAVQSAADALGGLQRQASALADVMDGRVNASHVSAHTDLFDQFGRPDNGAFKPLDIIASIGGEQGQRLRTAGLAVNDVRASLDRVLPSVLAKGGVGDQDITTSVSQGLYRDLGYDAKSAPDDIKKAINAVVSELNHAQDGGKGIGGVLDEVKIDASKFNDRLVAAVTDPIKKFGGDTAKLLQDNANKFIDGLTSLRQRMEAVGALYDQLAQTRTTNYRQQLQFQAEESGRPHQALDFASVSDLEYGFNARQQRLAGANGPQAFDPRFLGQELGRVREQVGAAVERQQKLFEAPEGQAGNSKAFAAAAEEVLRLKSRAGDLQQALKHLADTSERGAVIQEKLQRLQQEREGRLGFAERYVTASPEERLRLNQGLRLVNQVNNRGGSLEGLSPDQSRHVIETLNSLSGVTLTGLNGSPRADDLKRLILTQSLGGAFGLNPQQRADEQGLKNEATNRGKVAEQAIGELIKNQEAGNNKFFENLTSQQNDFFRRLSQILLQDKLKDVENKHAQAATELAELNKGDGRHLSLLSGVGVTSTVQLMALQSRRNELNELQVALDTRKSANDRIDEARAGLKRDGLDLFVKGGDAVENFLSAAKFQPTAVQRINRRYLSLFDEDPAIGRKWSEAGSNPDTLNAVARQALDRAIYAEKFAGDGLVQNAQRDVNTARSKLGGIAGVDPNAIERQLSDPKNSAEFLKALYAFNGGANKVEDFGKKLEEASAQVQRLAEQARQLREGFTGTSTTGTVEKRAAGGSIFRPHGTDTVPAMLTPGEFVVNARSAKANASLLKEINQSFKPLSEYGQAVDTKEAIKTATDTYEKARQVISKGLRWLGFSRGGSVPQYLAGGGTADDTRLAYLQIRKAGGTWTQQDQEEFARLQAAKAGNPYGFATVGSDSKPATPNQRKQLDDFIKKRSSPDFQDKARKARESQAAEAREKARMEAERNAKNTFNFYARSDPYGRSAQLRVQDLASERVRQRQQRQRVRDEKQAAHDSRVVSNDYWGNGGYTVIGPSGPSVIAGAETTTRNAVTDAARRNAARQRREKLYEKYGGRDKYEELQRRDASDNAAGNLAYRASVRNFNQLSSAANGPTRPGEEGQRAIAARVYGVQTQDLQNRYRQDESLRRYVNARVSRYATGGMVHGSGNADTVPALLTPGEFVLNRAAVARIGPDNVQRFNTGGPVGRVTYLASGGTAQGGVTADGEIKLSGEAVRAMDQLSATMNLFVQQAGGFGQAAQSLSQTFNVFAGTAKALTDAMTNFPKTLTVTGQHQVNVVHNGAEIFAQMPQFVEKLVVQKVNETLSRVFKEQMPEAGVHLN